MKTFVRILAVFICLSVAVASFASCHGRGGQIEEFKIDAEFNENEKVEISFWAKNDTNNVQKEIYNRAVEEFAKLYPNVTVNIKFYTDYGTIYNDVITNISTKTTPNVCISYPDHIATYMMGNNIMVSMDDLMRDSRYGFGGNLLKFEGKKSRFVAITLPSNLSSLFALMMPSSARRFNSVLASLLAISENLSSSLNFA